MRRLTTLIIALGAVLFFNDGMLGDMAFAQDASGDPVAQFSNQDEAMNAAQETAKQSLPLFLANTVAENGLALEGAGLKVAFPVSGPNNAEVIWVTPFKWDGDRFFVGILANQPNYMEGLNAGDPVNFSNDMIRDWSWFPPGGKLYGNFTTRVMIPMMDDDTAASMNEVLSDPAIPAEWQ